MDRYWGRSASLQNRVHQFNSGRGLQLHLIDFTAFFVSVGFLQGGLAIAGECGHRGIAFHLRALGDRQTRGGDDRIVRSYDRDLHRLDRGVGDCAMAAAVTGIGALGARSAFMRSATGRARLGLDGLHR